VFSLRYYSVSESFAALREAFSNARADGEVPNKDRFTLISDVSVPYQCRPFSAPDIWEWFYLNYMWRCLCIGHRTDGTDKELTLHWYVADKCESILRQQYADWQRWRFSVVWVLHADNLTCFLNYTRRVKGTRGWLLDYPKISVFTGQRRKAQTLISRKRYKPPVSLSWGQTGHTSQTLLSLASLITTSPVKFDRKAVLPFVRLKVALL
jgi:hypothetical protein